MDKRAAYKAVRSAIKSGALIRPTECTRCGESPSTTDGRAAIQAHHHDYSKPLDVEWICAKCHRSETPLPEVIGAPVFGSGNGAAKLIEPQILEIRQSNLSLRALGRIYGVDHKTIHRAKHGILWGQVAAPTPGASDGNEVKPE